MLTLMRWKAELETLEVEYNNSHDPLLVTHILMYRKDIRWLESQLALCSPETGRAPAIEESQS